MENVPGIMRGVGKEILDNVIDGLSVNYFIKYNIVNAADYGVPQIRKRFLLHGIRHDIYKKYYNADGFSLPQRTHGKVGSGEVQAWETVYTARDNKPCCLPDVRKKSRANKIHT